MVLAENMIMCDIKSLTKYTFTPQSHFNFIFKVKFDV